MGEDRMKRTLHTIRLWIMIAVLALSSLYIAPIASSASSFDVNAESAILVDFETGDVLFAKMQIHHCLLLV